MKEKITIVLTIFVMFTCIGVAIVFPRNSKLAVVNIKQGMPAGEIADTLKAKGVISSKLIFTIILRIIGADRKIKKGTYELNKDMSFIWLIKKLVSGSVIMEKLIVPEGFTAEQIADLVEQKKLGDRENFMNIVQKNKLEGYLFPETYLIPYDSSEKAIIEMMVKQFDTAFSDDMLEEAKKYKFTKEDVVILASIIEKEAVEESERKLISGVFHNRLKKKCYMESCATVQYALGKHKEKLRYKDLEIDSPYNTYKNFGLPPGPICNPGLSSLRAAVYPEDTDLMFFVSKGDGTHKFSRYYGRHMKYKKRN